MNGHSGDENVVAGGNGFGKHFAENQDQKGHYAGGYADGKIGKRLHGHGCGQGGSGNIDQVVANEDRGQQRVGIFFHPPDQPERCAPIFGQMNRFGFADREKRCLSRREEAGQNNENEQYEDLVCHDGDVPG